VKETGYRSKLKRRYEKRVQEIGYGCKRKKQVIEAGERS
jgi:hypothetical protein